MGNKFTNFATDELEALLAEYRTSNERGQFNWKIEEVEAELHERRNHVLIGEDAAGNLVVRTPEDSIGKVYAINWDKAGTNGAD